MMYPKMTDDIYMKKIKDLNFLYTNVLVCDNCYVHIKDITDEMAFREENKIPESKIGWMIKWESSIEFEEEDINDDSFEKFWKRMSTLK